MTDGIRWIKTCNGCWWARQDSNLGPRDYEGLKNQ